MPLRQSLLDGGDGQHCEADGPCGWIKINSQQPFDADDGGNEHRLGRRSLGQDNGVWAEGLTPCAIGSVVAPALFGIELLTRKPDGGCDDVVRDFEGVRQGVEQKLCLGKLAIAEVGEPSETFRNISIAGPLNENRRR